MSKWLARHCACGGSMRARSSPASLAEQLVGEFERVHSGDGHWPVTPRQAARARKASDEAARMEPPSGGSDV